MKICEVSLKYRGRVFDEACKEFMINYSIASVV